MADIKLDFDGFVDWAELASRMAFISKISECGFEGIRVFRTRRGFHVYCSLPQEISDMQIVAIQAMLGSDMVREAFNMRRVQRGVHGWNVLFRSKASKDKDISYEEHSQEIEDELNLLYHEECANALAESIESINAVA